MSHVRRTGPRWQVEAWVSTYTAIAAGEMDGVDGDIEHLIGRRPCHFEDLLLGAVMVLR